MTTALLVAATVVVVLALTYARREVARQDLDSLNRHNHAREALRRIGKDQR